MEYQWIVLRSQTRDIEEVPLEQFLHTRGAHPLVRWLVAAGIAISGIPEALCHDIIVLFHQTHIDTSIFATLIMLSSKSSTSPKI